MPTVGSRADDGVSGTAPLVRMSMRFLYRIRSLTFQLGTLAAFLAGVGFMMFMWRLPGTEVALERDADGIVVLTGGASRINDAIELLAAGRGKRLLISGLNRATTSGEISRLNPEFSRLVDCCVDFDRSLNTLGNAIETRRWAEMRGFHSLIVVTSNYHMPRALAEIAHQLPDVALVPFAVVTDRQRADPWWKGRTTARLMVTEYVKFVSAKFRMGLNLSRTANAAS